MSTAKRYYCDPVEDTAIGLGTLDGQKYRTALTQEWAALCQVVASTMGQPPQVYARKMELEEILFPYPGMARVYTKVHGE